MIAKQPGHELVATNRRPQRQQLQLPMKRPHRATTNTAAEANMSHTKESIQTTAATDASHPLWLRDWKEGPGEATIGKRSAKTQSEKERREVMSFYCSWFCPFAQRAWIALEELGIPYQYIEINPYRVDPREPGGYTKKSLSFQEKRELMPAFMDASPRGLVPAVKDAGGQRIWESSIVMEYLDQAHGDNLLYTKHPEITALIRISVEHCSSRIQKSYYHFLMAQSADEQATSKQDFFRECRALACAMAPNSVNPQPHEILKDTKEAIDKDAAAMQRLDVATLARVSEEAFMERYHIQPGPYFLGSHFSAVDVALAPFWQRILWVGERYRDLKLPNDAAFVRLNQWWQAVSERPSVANTFVGKERLISSYKQYASNLATSDWSNTVKTHMKESSRIGSCRNHAECLQKR